MSKGLTFAREKRLLLGWLALLIPMPLPLEDVLEWPVLFAYSGLVIYFINRVDSGHDRWLSNRVLNLLGLAYMPFLAIDLYRAMSREQPVRALLHLILFLVVVKLFALRRERDKWHVFIAIYVLFVAAMASSSNLTISFYLVAALLAGFYVMARFAHLHVLTVVGDGSVGMTSEERRTRRSKPFPRVRWTTVIATFLVIAISIPIFASMPRLRQPFIMGRGGGNAGLSRTTGFSDAVDLSLTSEVRGNRAVAMRMQFSEPPAVDDLRFKGATYDFYRRQSWFRHPSEVRGLRRQGDRRFHMPETDAGASASSSQTSEVTIFLEPLNSSSLVLPVETRNFLLQSPLARLRLDSGGAVQLPNLPPRQTLRYDVEIGRDPWISAVLERPAEESEEQVPGRRNRPADALDLGGVTPEIEALAEQVMAGEGLSDGERIDLVLRHLLNNYAYTVDFVGRDGKNPIDDFLFEYGSGHCEYFATSMVMLLRSQGIPARFVTGFLGAEFNPLEDYYIVRQQNAHAWVEAWTEERGWQIYDPTPPDGRPSQAERDWKLVFQQIYDYMAFRWDRYVLTYGSDDQESFFREARERLAAFWQDLWDESEETIPAALPPSSEDDDLLATIGAGEQAFWQDPKVRYGGLALFLLLMGGGVGWFYWRPLSPEEAYDRLRRGTASRGLPVGHAVAPFELRDLLASAHPAVADDVRALVATYVASSFAGLPADDHRAKELRSQLRRILAAVTKEMKARRKAETRARRQKGVVAVGSTGQVHH